MNHPLRLVTNRPGLAAIAYRIATHGRFKQDLLARLAGEPALRGLTTRSDDDFSVALLDAWASAADVLTFYQERIANESYLRTATEPGSLRQLARLLGHELGPGVAATTVVAFTVDPISSRNQPITVPPGTRIQSLPAPGQLPRSFETDTPLLARASFNELRASLLAPPTPTVLRRDGAQILALRLRTGASVRAGDLLLAPDTTAPARTAIITSVTPLAPDLLEFTAERWSSAPPESLPPLQILRRRAALFGHNAPDPNTLEFTNNALLFDNLPPTREWKAFKLTDDTTLDLDSVQPDLAVGERIVVHEADLVHVATITRVDTVARAGFGLSGRITRLQLADPHGAAIPDFTRRGAEVLLAPAPLPLLGVTRSDPVADSTLELAGLHPDLRPGRPILLTGPLSDSDAVVSELASVALTDLDPDTSTTTLTLAAPLVHRFRRDTLRVRANLALASHGETLHEILGSGDASVPLQRFPLRQPPLAFLTAATTLGRSSSLEVRVDGEAWREVDDLESAGPRDRVYTLALTDDGGATVQFGDGTRGARLPTGDGNVRATYRRGGGLDGQVPADSLTLLSAPTLGLVGVTNPLAAAGAADPDSPADARRNAPLRVRTLGRVVSLRDYEDFARAFTGVARAHAARFSAGPRPLVLVTVAGIDGAAIGLGSPTAVHLLAALRGSGDPSVVVRLHSHDPLAEPPPTFTIAGRITVAPDRDLELTRLAIHAALIAGFGFGAADFGRAIARSAVIAAIQAVPGVLAVDLGAFHRTRQPIPASPQVRLLPRIAAGPEPGDPPTELLTLDPAALAHLEVTR